MRRASSLTLSPSASILPSIAALSSLVVATAAMRSLITSSSPSLSLLSFPPPTPPPPPLCVCLAFSLPFALFILAFLLSSPASTSLPPLSLSSEWEEEEGEEREGSELSTAVSQRSDIGSASKEGGGGGMQVRRSQVGDTSSRDSAMSVVFRPSFSSSVAKGRTLSPKKGEVRHGEAHLLDAEVLTVRRRTTPPRPRPSTADQYLRQRRTMKIMSGNRPIGHLFHNVKSGLRQSAEGDKKAGVVMKTTSRSTFGPFFWRGRGRRQAEKRRWWWWW
uniref:Uncharacterized protein n=1 Tax=Palpitomonas bilix TaxID=652834 RepID=A0A7S3G751_9EUKA|mmetsp:Transcript_26917/g.69205  ORF Transcript_26917/g.69205 Transcript_26917/m.69205 type:complete len:275 (+) Transcript_26917:203-1027(+)